MLTIHEGTLEKLFRKNFSEEIRRLAVGTGKADATPLSPSVKSAEDSKPSLYERSVNRSLTSVSTSRPTQNGPLQLSRPTMMSSPPSGLLSAGISTAGSQHEGHTPGQTPLQRHLAHLVRHGFNGVASRPDDDSHLSQSPPSSSANLPGGGPGSVSITSVPGSGSIRTRISNKFGSLSFGRG